MKDSNEEFTLKDDSNFVREITAISGKIKNLIIAPHADDEVLGCASVLNEDSFVFYCGLDESLIRPDPKHRIGIQARLEEVKRVAEYAKFKYYCYLNSKVNYYKDIEFINLFEDLINVLKPDRIFIPFPCYNQDHRAVYHASLVALRPHDKNFFVKKVIVYEEPHSVIWEDKNFKVNFFIPIDIERKLKIYHMHSSQVRGMRSPQILMAMARLRGANINCEYAEAFRILRWAD
jgi:hypothetical protein